MRFEAQTQIQTLDSSTSAKNSNFPSAGRIQKSPSFYISFGRNSTSSQMKSGGKESQERPTIWNDLNKDRNNPSSGSLASNIGSGLLTNAQITLTELAYQVNPLRGFSNITDGISTDLRNMRTELGINTQTLNPISSQPSSRS